MNRRGIAFAIQRLSLILAETVTLLHPLSYTCWRECQSLEWRVWRQFQHGITTNHLSRYRSLCWFGPDGHVHVFHLNHPCTICLFAWRLGISWSCIRCSFPATWFVQGRVWKQVYSGRRVQRSKQIHESTWWDLPLWRWSGRWHFSWSAGRMKILKHNLYT